MPSSANRYQIVTRALNLSGRGNELRAQANDWLNEMLRDWALDFQYPQLRVVGVAGTLPTGSSTATLPTDFGISFAKQGILFGVEKIPLDEKEYEEFVSLWGFPGSTTSPGRPRFYMVDRNGGNIVFNSVADQSYPFLMTYYKVPADIPTDATGDGQQVWVSSDNVVTQGLIERIYQFTLDEREQTQHQKVYHPEEGLLSKWQRQVAKMGGQNRLQLSPARFRTVRWGW